MADAVLEAINRLENRIEGIHETTGQIRVDVGVLGERVDNMSNRVDGLNGKVESAITTASEAKRLARRWGSIVAAIISTGGVIAAALIHANMGE